MREHGQLQIPAGKTVELAPGGVHLMLMGLKRFTKQEPFNMKEARQEIAARLIAENRYCF